MGLVGYSDSEGSDSETPVVAPLTTAKPPTRTIKPGFQKVVDTAGARKIKVDLPTAQPDINDDDQRPAKKPRTAGLGGFNSFLPAPKRTAEQKKPGLGAGVNLRTGAEPAFSRERVEPDLPAASQDVQASDTVSGLPTEQEKPKEVKIVGNAMRFKPLSVANKKPKKKSTAPIIPPPTQPSTTSTTTTVPAPALPPPKKKVSLFSITETADLPTKVPQPSSYQPLLADSIPEAPEPTLSSQPPPQHDPPHPTNPNSLDQIANTLNLSPSARRQLFGRTKDPSSALAAAAASATIKHFDMDAEYNANERLRREGQAQEHRAVKAVAPGKHSLQQLVNAASTQREALEDKWAEGKRNKAEGGSKYGW